MSMALPMAKRPLSISVELGIEEAQREVARHRNRPFDPHVDERVVQLGR